MEMDFEDEGQYITYGKLHYWIHGISVRNRSESV